MLRIFKNGDQFRIETDITTSNKLLQQMSEAIEQIAVDYNGDVEFQLSFLLPMFYELLLKLDGYKDTTKKIIYVGEQYDIKDIINNKKEK